MQHNQSSPSNQRYLSSEGLCVLTSRPYQLDQSEDIAPMERLINKTKKMIEPEYLNRPIELKIAERILKSEITNTSNEQRMLTGPLEKLENLGISLIDAGDIDDREMRMIDQEAREIVEEIELLNLRMNVMERLLTKLREMDNHPDSFNIHREFCDRMTSELKRWDSLSLKKKFGNQQKYVQFRQRLGEAYQDESAFLSVKSHLAAEDENNSDDEDSSGDELELAGGTQSYKCPLCIRYLSKPMVSKICKHSFCQDCFKSLLESSYNGKVGCPKFGCDKLLDLLSVDLDEGLGQRVNQFRRRAERREIEQEFEDDDEQVESDHDDEGSKRIIDKSSSKKTNVGSQRRKRIVVEDVEDD